jgi:hypothetical protein
VGRGLTGRADVALGKAFDEMIRYAGDQFIRLHVRRGPLKGHCCPILRVCLDHLWVEGHKECDN